MFDSVSTSVMIEYAYLVVDRLVWPACTGMQATEGHLGHTCSTAPCQRSRALGERVIDGRIQG